MNKPDFKSAIRKGISPESFNGLCLDLFRYQARNNPVYHNFLQNLGKDPETVDSVEQIPFLPVSFFKTLEIRTGNDPVKEIFTSSGTTGSAASRHPVSDPQFYLDNTVMNFSVFYGHPSNFHILALLPGYLERKGSSLIKMVDYFIQLGSGGFFLNNYEELLAEIKKSQQQKRKTILIGVTHALVDLAEKYQPDLHNIIVMETGGMKGRKKEMVREELHSLLKSKFNIGSIHSEYGMTELFSQAYSSGNGIFHCPPTMKILIRDISDPFTTLPENRSGAVNIIDLANTDSCAFIATDDVGKVFSDHSFEILGRTDTSDLRGCNLMVA